MTLYNIFNTKEEAEAAQAYDYNLLLDNNSSVDKYCQDTINWAEVIELPDGKFGYIPYQFSDAVYTTGEYLLEVEEQNT